MSSSNRPSQGSLTDYPFAFLLASLRREEFTGVLQIAAAAPLHEDDRRDDADPGEAAASDDAGHRGSAGRDDSADVDETAPTREVHFASGHIAWAISTDREESLKAFLVRHGTVTQTQWEEAEERARQESLRSALTGMGIIAPRELTRLEISRVEEIVSRLFAVGEGTFRVRERQLPPGTPDLEIDASALLINGVMETADRSFLDRATGSMDAVFAFAGPSPDDALLERLTVRGEFQAILKHVDGARSIGEICSLTSLPDHFVRCVFAALSLLECVRRVDAGEAVAAPAREPEAPRERSVVMAAAPEPPAREPAPAVEDHPARILRFERAVPAPVSEMAVTPKAHGSPDDHDPFDDAAADQSPIEERFRIEERDFAARDLAAMEDADSSPSVYDGAGRETSRAWFLVGAAMAVGLAAVFLILFSRDRNGAIDLGREAERAALDQKDSDAVPPGALVSGPSISNDRPSTSAPPETVAQRPAAATPEPVVPRQDPPRPQSSPSLAPATQTPILPSEPAVTGSSGRAGADVGSETTRPAPAAPSMGARQTGLAGQESLARPASTRGDWSIQLLLACEEATIDRAIRQSGQSSQLFLLPVTHQGRACHRVYWGRYADRADAEMALHNVPIAYRTGGVRPWVTRLPS